MKTHRLMAAAGLAALLSVSVGLAQTGPDHTSSVAVAGSVVFPADDHTETSVGGSFELEFPLSSSFSVGAIAGHWSGQSDFVKDSTETYFAGVMTLRSSGGRWRPFVQLGGGLYFVKFQFTSRNRFAPGDTDSVGGGFVGPGLDYALSSRSAVVVIARYHLVSDVSGVHTDFLETQAGVRFFF
jgi:hypothetical protein